MKIGICGLAGSGKDTAALTLRRVLYEQGSHLRLIVMLHYSRSALS